jgi:AcrR family transcriptional regulator
VTTVRPLRADAERNRRKIVRAAIEVVARRGLDAGVDEIAQLAGVGRGTVYRRFPTRDELVRAIVLDRTAEALAAMERAAAEPDPWAALEGALHALGEHLAGDRGLFDTLTGGGRPVDVVPERPGWFLAALEPALTRCREAGIVRDDIAATDLVALAAAVSQVVPAAASGPPALWERYLALALDGLRGPAPGPVPHDPPDQPPRIR